MVHLQQLRLVFKHSYCQDSLASLNFLIWQPFKVITQCRALCCSSQCCDAWPFKNMDVNFCNLCTVTYMTRCLSMLYCLLFEKTQVRLESEKKGTYMMNNIHKWLTQNTNEVYLHENMTSAITTNFRCWMFDMLSNRASVTSNTINPMKERTPTAIPRLHALVLKSYGQMSDQLGMLAMQLNTTMEKTYSRKKQTQKISKNIKLCHSNV